MRNLRRIEKKIWILSFPPHKCPYRGLKKLHKSNKMWIIFQKDKNQLYNIYIILFLQIQFAPNHPS
jgi:hypothetical protein